MAQFTGSGTFTVQGSNTRIDRCLFSSGTTLSLNGEAAVVDHCNVQGTLEVLANYCRVSNSSVRVTDWQGHTGLLTECLVVVGAISVTGARWAMSDCILSSSAGVDIETDDCRITNNTFYRVTSGNDCLSLDGNRSLVESNKFIPLVSSTKSAVNVIGGECNMVVGNDLGDPDDYATDALIDTGANTQLFYPSDATYGDNFTDCGTGS